MEKLIECVPNFSEGKNKEIIKKIATSIKKSKGVKVLDINSDIDHNRSVITFIGSPEKVIEAMFLGAKTASKLIDLSKHKGVHPRIGATDVIPIVPLKNTSTQECVELAKKLGEKIGKELKIPVYLYEKATTREHNRNLSNIRNIGFEKLKFLIKTDQKRSPDFGPKNLRKAGAIALGVRNFLIAFNVNLKTTDTNIAKNIAKKIREKNGGFKYLKALGLSLKSKNCVQVSMNFINYKKTPISKVFKKIEQEAKKYKTKILESELIGLIPKDGFKNTSPKKLKLKDFSRKRFLPI